MTRSLYFAYGSNLHPRRLGERVPSAVPIGVACLTAHTLRFHKRGRDGSGKCDAWWTGAASDRVIGVVFRLAPVDVDRLDRIEGVGVGYDVSEVRVGLTDGDTTAFTYRATADAVDATLAPWEWYKALVLLGARHHRLPADYVERIEDVVARPDPDAARAAEHAALLARMEASA